MRSADRLLKLLQILRRHRQPVTAGAIASELEVCVRTVYRDIAGLIGAGVPIRGEAGIGYVLGEGYDLPPLMFNADEIEAMLVGLRWVEERGDVGVARATWNFVRAQAVRRGGRRGDNSSRYFSGATAGRGGNL